MNNPGRSVPPTISSQQNFTRQKIKRLVQILRITQIALLLVSIMTISAGRYSDSITMMATGIFLFSVDWAIYKKHPVTATAIFLCSLTLMLSYLAWTGSGIRDSALLGYCGVLIFAAMLGNKRLLVVLLCIMVLMLMSIAYVNDYGIHQNTIEPINLITGSITVVILIVIGIAVWMLAHDYRSALDELARENERVKNAKTHIEHMAMHDPLTGLCNRMMAQRNFDNLFRDARARQNLLGIIFIDLDNLKPINDSLGHQAGDQILKEVALRLLSYTKDADRVCRYGGDEFIVFMPHIQTAEQVSQASLEILQLVSENYLYRNIEIFCTCSIGIALAPQDGDDLDTLIKKADIAMYHSKDSGRNSFRFFNPAISRNMLEHISLISGMRKALQENQFSLHYQPKINLQTNEICGLEALLRWHHPEQGYISPATFIPLAESSGLIIQLGEWVIIEACEQAKRWYDQGLLEFAVAVNISSIQFKRGNIDTIVLGSLAASGLPPQYLELELTESLLIEDSERLSTTLSALRAEGVHLSIDDFGTGYSNLGYLKKFEVEALKIDQSFVRKMDDQTGDAAIVRAIIQMSASLGLKTIAEGVEDASTAALLRSLGCTQAQGYYWARPMPADEVPGFIEFWRKDQE
ncbi:bifunctional diguanylate cyclase/phosphodiesterase [Cellvibrio sp. pealriver]|uniref:putative bifunctional diguanylate cyclase/phosphodiesterase n=1 Tax=Cellvibrio sp. pealriver TaxID=1622269 RepID=UPI00066FBDB6|nr:EAL domain-containing protein [Cellvibrio sp. pealriver]